MRTLKDITVEEAIEIAALAYGKIEKLTNPIEVHYSAFQPIDLPNKIFEEYPEQILIKFMVDADEIRLRITNDLSLSMHSFREKPFSYITLPIHNQYEIFKKFINEWELKPSK